MTEKEWRSCGTPIPCALGHLEMRARPVSLSGRDVLVISVRLAKKVDFDLCLTVRLAYHDAPDTERSVAFGNGVLPADRAAVGDVYTFGFAPAGRVKSCRVDPVVIGDFGQEL